MSQQTDHIAPFPPLQHQIIDWLELERHRHSMHALIEVDVTETRRAIRAYRARTGAPLSLTSFLIACLARAVDANRAMQAYRLGRRRLVHFADVDVGIMVERAAQGGKFPMPSIIRAANTKSLQEIEREVRMAQQEPVDAVAVRSLPRWLQPLLMHGLSLWLLLPGAVRRLMWAWALRNPYRRKSLTGTVGLTAVSMFGHGTGWGIAPMAHTLTLVVGGLARKPGMAGTGIEEREFLCLTLTFDHDVIDGAPAARFAQQLIHLIESGASLNEPEHAREQSGIADDARELDGVADDMRGFGVAARR